MLARKVTSTDIVIQRLRDIGVQLERGTQSDGAFRIQPKMTGCESRRMLSEWRQYTQKYHDCQWQLPSGKCGSGIDLYNSVKELASCPIENFLLEEIADDWCLWLSVKTTN